MGAFHRVVTDLDGVLFSLSLAIALGQDTASASVSTSLVASTVKAGTLVAAGAALTAAVVSAPVVSLTEGMVKAMFLMKLKVGMVVLLGMSMIGTGAALLSQRSLAAGERAPHRERGTDNQVTEGSLEDNTPERTPNFRVDAPTAQLARRIGRAAERYRKEKALEWLGKELPPWSEPCPIHVQLAVDTSGGATSLVFANDKVTRQHMTLQGWLDRILKADLPHEITHVILAHHFGSPMPRWADEGAAVLSADDLERDRNEKALQQILSKPGRFIPLRQLFAYPDYPEDVTALLAEGYSVTRFLVESKGRKTFLRLVSEGMRDGWDKAVKHHYGYANVDTAEAVWLQRVKQRAMKDVRESEPNHQPIGRSGRENPLQGSEVDRKLARAFGKDCKEVRTALVKLEISSPHLILATNQVAIERDGRVTFAPCWYARFEKEQGVSEEAYVTTIYSDQACFRFDGPVSNINDLAHRMVMSIEPSGKVRIAFPSHIPTARP